MRKILLAILLSFSLTLPNLAQQLSGKVTIGGRATVVGERDLSGALTRLNGGSYFIANAGYLSDPQSTNEPDWDKAGPCSIVKVGPTDYRMWYEGVTPTKLLDPSNQPGTFDYDTVICYATSTDGLTWTKRDANSNSITDTLVSVAITPTNPPGGSLAWMRAESSIGTIMYDADEGIFKLWGHGGNNSGARAIFYATSADGFSWTIQNNGQPVLQRSAVGGRFDENWVADAKVIKISTTSYIMLFRANPASGGPQIGLATSSDGVSWTKFGTTPVIGYGTSGQWDDSAIYSGGLIRTTNGNLHYWYGGDGVGDTAGQGLGYAKSTDNGQTWVRGANNPVISETPSGLDSVSVGDTIWAYVESPTKIRVSWGSEKNVPPYFRGRLQADL